MKLPPARNESIAVQELENETLVYDFEIDKAYCLNETLTVVYRHCNGKTSVDDLKRRYKYTADLIYFALDELKANNLIADYGGSHFANLSRRDVIKKVGLATMTALPIIHAIVAPKAAAASSVVSQCNQVKCADGVGNCSNCGVGNVCCAADFFLACSCQTPDSCLLELGGEICPPAILL